MHEALLESPGVESAQAVERGGGAMLQGYCM